MDSAEREELRPKGNVPNLRFPEFQGEWEKCTLGNNVKIQGGYAFKSELFLRKGIPIIRISNLPQNASFVDLDDCTYYKEGNYNSFEVHNGDLLIAMSGATTGKTAIYNKKTLAYLNQRVGLFKSTNSDSLYYPFLYAFVSTPVFKRQLSTRLIAGAQPNISSSDIESIRISIPQKTSEQEKIAHLMLLLDKRIATQNKIIEDLKKLKSAIVEMEYSHMTKNISHIGDFIEQTSKRNKDSVIQNVLSVSNSQGFIQQSEQFENRIVASDDTSNYKIVERNDFAFNPARINVGSIARLITFERGIVSPMYICFRTKCNLFPEYLDYYFESKQFFTEIQKRLEGSVRQCLSFDGLCNIPLCVPSVEIQRQIGKRLSTLVQEIKLEIDFLELLQKQKKFLLYQMFI